MIGTSLRSRLAQIIEQQIPLPGLGETRERHRLIAEIGREDLTLAKLAEAHWDAVAILAEAGRSPVPHAFYAVQTSSTAPW